MIRKLGLLALAVAGLGACAENKAREDGVDYGEPALVTVEGWAETEGATPAKERALDDARREAVALAIRTHLPASTLAAKTVELEKLSADPTRYIIDHTVLSEAVDGKYLKLKLEAAVLFEKVGADLRKAGLASGAPEDKASLALALAGPCGDALERSLGATGFQVIRSTPPAEGAAPGHDAATALARAHRAVFGASARCRITRDAMGTSDAAIELVVADDKGQPIAKLTGPGVAHHKTAEVSEAKAAAVAADSAAEQLMEKAGKKLARTNLIMTKVLGIGAPNEVRRLMDRLRGMEEVSAVTLEKYSQGNAMLGVWTRARRGEDLAALILRDATFRFDVRAVFPQELELERR